MLAPVRLKSTEVSAAQEDDTTAAVKRMKSHTFADIDALMSTFVAQSAKTSLTESFASSVVETVKRAHDDPTAGARHHDALEYPWIPLVDLFLYLL